jgi:hypothetical protein
MNKIYPYGTEVELSGVPSMNGAVADVVGLATLGVVNLYIVKLREEVDVLGFGKTDFVTMPDGCLRERA